MLSALDAAKKVALHLKNHGFTTLFAGGWVRDYLLERPSDDIDIATAARPDQVEEIFDKTHAVGASFGVILVCEEGHTFEVATFRSDGLYQNGRHPESITYSSPKEDAQRRDFTINGLFFDPISEQVIDYVGGQEDLRSQCIRAIGIAQERFEEDRLRMLRAVRFAAKLGFHIEQQTLQAIKKFSHSLLPSVSIERIWQEFDKMAQGPRFEQSLHDLDALGLLQTFLPNAKPPIKEVIMDLQQHQTPSELYLPLLLGHAKEAEMLELCAFFKLSNKQKKRMQAFSHFCQLNLQGSSSIEWAYIYSTEDIAHLLQVASFLPHFQDIKQFKEAHEKRMKELAPFIHRIKDKNPVLKAVDLTAHGIPKGPLMGQLLREAEGIAAAKGIEEKEELLVELKKSRVWPKKL